MCLPSQPRLLLAKWEQSSEGYSRSVCAVRSAQSRRADWAGLGSGSLHSEVLVKKKANPERPAPLEGGINLAPSGSLNTGH